MTTREAIENLQDSIRERIEAYRAEYKAAEMEKDEHKRHIGKEIARAEAWGYIRGLKDADVITEQQRKILTVYATI